MFVRSNAARQADAIISSESNDVAVRCRCIASVRNGLGHAVLALLQTVSGGSNVLILMRVSFSRKKTEI